MVRGKDAGNPGKARGKRVPVVVTVEGAQEVVLTGDFTGWALDQVRLKKGQGNQWSTELVLPPGEYQYRLRVDGAWWDDPGSSKVVPNPFGTQNGILLVT